MLLFWQALQKAWTDACAATGQPQLVIPKGDYTVGPVLFKGKCKGSVTIQLDGNLLADTNLNRYTSNWLDFQYVDGLTIKGKGKLDGQGSTAWPHNTCPKKWHCKLLPMVRFKQLLTSYYVTFAFTYTVDHNAATDLYSHSRLYRSALLRMRGSGESPRSTASSST